MGLSCVHVGGIGGELGVLLELGKSDWLDDDMDVEAVETHVNIDVSIMPQSYDFICCKATAQHNSVCFSIFTLRISRIIPVKK